MAVRLESVRLEVEGNFVHEMLSAAAATKVLKAELNNLSGNAVRGTGREMDAAAKSTAKLGDEVEGVSRKTQKAAPEIDKLSGRVRILRDVAVTLGPALIPVGAVAIPAVVGLTGALGAAAAGVGVAVAAFHGMGDALKAFNEYEAAPTQANLEKMRAELDKLGPAGAEFVRFIGQLEPQLAQLQMLAREGLLPGVEDGISSLMRLMPEAKRLVFDLATEMGKLSRETGEALSGQEFEAFFNYLQTDAAPTLEQFAHTIGYVGQGLANLMVAFAPLTRDFNSGMESMARSFANWSAGLSKTQGFQNFVEYVRDSGPQVIALIGSIADALVGIIRAAAPMGHVVLPVLTALAKIIGTIANSPLGTPFFTAIAGVLAFNRAAALAQASLDRIRTSSEAAGSSLRSSLALGGVIAGLTLVNQLVDQLGTKVDSGALARNLEAIGRGSVSDDLQGIGHSIYYMSRAMNSVEEPVLELTTGFGILGDTTLDSVQKKVREVDDALAALVESGHPKRAAEAFSEFAAQARAQGVSLDDINKAFPQYNTALGNAAAEAAKAKAPTDAYQDAIKRTGNAAGLTRSELAGLSNAMKEQRQQALAGFDAETQYRQALKDAAEQAQKSSAGIRGNSDEVLQNRSALSQLASAWNNQSDAVRNNVGRYKEAKQAFIQTAMQMGVNAQKAADLARKYLAVPDQVLTKISMVGTEEAYRALQGLRAQYDYFRDKTVHINVATNATVAEGYANRPGRGSADGGTVPKTGRPYADRHPYLLADGEEVISNRHGQADRHRGLLKAINAGRLADGGTVGGGRQIHLGNLPDPLKHYALAFDKLDALSERFGGLSKGVGDSRSRLERWSDRLEKAADKQVQLAQRELDLGKKKLDAIRDEIKALKDQRDQLSASVAANFRSDIFGGNVDLVQAYQSGALGNGVMNDAMSWFAQQASAAQSSGSDAPSYSSLSDLLQQYLATLSPSAIQDLQNQAMVGTLKGDTSQSLAFSQVLSYLSSQGLSGSAFTDLATSGNAQAAQYLAGLSPTDLAAFQSLYGSRDQQNAATGGVAAAGAGLTQEIASLRSEATKQREINADSRDELREANRKAARLQREVESLRGDVQSVRAAVQQNAKDVTAGVNGAAAAGAKGGKRG